MKLGQVSQLVVNFLRGHPGQEYTANTLLMHLGLPLHEKRRLYDVIEVLSCAKLIEVRKEARKRHFYWKPEPLIESTETVVIDLPTDAVFQEAGTILELMLQFNQSAFKELSNLPALRMLERDIKRTVWGANAVSVVRVTLKNEQGRILKEATTGVLPATV